MLNKNHFKDLLIYILVIALFIIAGFIIRPVITAIIYGILFGYIFYSIYRRILKVIKNETVAAGLVCFGVLLILFIAFSIALNTLASQLVDIYFTLQKLNLGNILAGAFPNIAGFEFSTTILNSVNTFFSGFIANYVTKFGDFILNLPAILLQLFIVFFIFFFSLKDGKRAIAYVNSLSPLKSEINEKFSKQFKDITNSVLIGQVVVGIIQGVIAGVGYFIFGVPNALLLTILTMLIGIIPVIGPWLVWIPIDIYLFASGNSVAGIGLLVYGLLLINWVDAIIRPLIVSRRTQINPGIVIIGMIGGLFTFGILGLILGPLILGYVLLVLEIYFFSHRTLYLILTLSLPFQ